MEEKKEKADGSGKKHIAWNVDASQVTDHVWFLFSLKLSSCWTSTQSYRGVQLADSCFPWGAWNKCSRPAHFEVAQCRYAAEWSNLWTIFPAAYAFELFKALRGMSPTLWIEFGCQLLSETWSWRGNFCSWSKMNSCWGLFQNSFRVFWWDLRSRGWGKPDLGNICIYVCLYVRIYIPTHVNTYKYTYEHEYICMLRLCVYAFK